MKTHMIAFLLEKAVGDKEHELVFTRHLPWVPRKGDMIAVIECDDLREVETVYWSPVEGLCVRFKYDPRVTIETLLKRGWVKLHRRSRRS